MAPATFYRWFAERQRELTRFGRARRARTERRRLALLGRYTNPPGDFLEIGPGRGHVAHLVQQAGWRYRAVEASPELAADLRAHGFTVLEAFVPPIPETDHSQDVVYADQVLEHMAGIEQARAFVAEAHRVLRPRGTLFVVVPDYLKERAFFWDVDYTHNFVTTERRVRQLLYDGGFSIEAVVHSIGPATGAARDLLAFAAAFARLPGLDDLARRTGTSEIVFRIRKNLFATFEVVARKISA